METHKKTNQDKLRDWLCGLVTLPPNGSVLDAGCGDGGDLRRISRRLQSHAYLVGVDTREDALENARAAAEGDARFSFFSADLSLLWPFAAETFDGVFSNNALECFVDRQAFLAEAARVLRPGGQIVCAHWDHEMQTIDGSDNALVRKITAAFSDWRQAWMTDADGWMGRRLWPAFQASGRFAGRIETYTLTETAFVPGWYGYDQIQAFSALVRRGLILQEEYRRFYEEVEALAGRGEYFYSRTLYVYVGNKL